MTKLVEIVKENVGKSSYEMRQFFQQMVKGGELKAYCVEVNKRVVKKDTEDEKVIKIRKGITLTPIEELRKYPHVFIEDPETGVKYNLNIESRGGMFFNDGDSQIIYHHCVLERLAQQFDSKKVMSRFHGGISIPIEMVNARLRVCYEQDWESRGESDYVAATRGNLVIEGEQDKLFEKVCKFVRGK